MLQLSRWKVVLVVLAALIGIVFSAPNVLPQSVLSNMPAWAAKKLNLGLDLQGGSYLLLEVDTAKLGREKLVNLVEEVRQLMRTNSIPVTGPIERGGVVTVRVTNPADVDKAFRALQALSQPVAGGMGKFTLNVRRAEDQQITLARTPDAITEEATHAVEQSVEIIGRRVDELGTREPAIFRQGANRIVVQAAGESDPERLKEIIGKTAKLTFQMVDDTVTAQEAQMGRIPPGSELLPSEEEGALLVKRRAVVTGEMLTSASQDFHQQTGAPIVSFRFDGDGARRFGEATTQNVGKRFAIVLDGKVISAPVINVAITGGAGYIEGNFSVESANNLAILLRAGALPAELSVEQQSTVGAELGADAVSAGQTATIIAFVGVLVFMVLAYGFLFGGISVVALLVNGLLIIAALSVTQATLTLPGIAGLILTLAMAVDANVLIYERMRDEARAGRPPLQAMNAGFSSAIVTIFDANLTTLIAAWIMFFFGAGPVRGFAWTLSIGVITSVFTAVLITQVLLAVWFRARRPKTLPIA